MNVSIIIPCYNEEANINEIVSRFDQIKEYNIELILVDNGSADKTREEILKCVGERNYVKLAIVDENKGYGFGILRGLETATGDVLGWMHADMQSDPKVFCEMIDSAEKEDCIFLYKGKRKNRPVVDTFFTFGMSVLESLYLKKCLWDINAQPTLLSKEYYEMWESPPYDFSLDLYVYYFAKLKKIKILRFESIQHERANGKSSWNTGMGSRFKLVKRVISYSIEMKKRLRNN